jgi:hypothetical protein
MPFKGEGLGLGIHSTLLLEGHRRQAKGERRYLINAASPKLR